MSDQNVQASNEPTFHLQRVYIKDLSLEMPNAPTIFLEQDTPKVLVDINVGASPLAETIFESIITITVTTRINDKVLYLIEATQGGIFEMTNIPKEQVDQLLGIVCPTMLYPYLRANIADAISRTSIPPLHLADVNFQALFEQRMAQLAEQENKAQADGASSTVLPGSDAPQ